MRQIRVVVVLVVMGGKTLAQLCRLLTTAKLKSALYSTPSQSMYTFAGRHS